MRCATFNVLADAYTSYGDYSNVDAELMVPGGRTIGLVNLINSLNADVIGLQEAELPLVEALSNYDNWQTFWSPKVNNKADGCLTLVRHDIDVQRFDTHSYSDGSGHIAQILHIGKTVIANTHIKWAPLDSTEHIGIAQAEELLHVIGTEQAAVIFADCNDRPGGPVRQTMKEAGFSNLDNLEPTAIVNSELVSLDILAVRGLSANMVNTSIDVSTIPSWECPSDHVPLVANIG